MNGRARRKRGCCRQDEHRDGTRTANAAEVRKYQGIMERTFSSLLSKKPAEATHPNRRGGRLLPHRRPPPSRKPHVKHHRGSRRRPLHLERAEAPPQAGTARGEPRRPRPAGQAAHRRAGSSSAPCVRLGPAPPAQGRRPELPSAARGHFPRPRPGARLSLAAPPHSALSAAARCRRRPASPAAPPALGLPAGLAQCAASGRRRQPAAETRSPARPVRARRSARTG